MSEFDQRISPATKWLKSAGRVPFSFQLDVWKHYLEGESGIVNAPTGSGKTYSLMIPIALEALESGDWQNDLQAIWITPIRALAREIQHAGQEQLRLIENGSCIIGI